MSSAPEWIAAIGTAGATLLAGGALAVQQRDRRRQRAEKLAGWLNLREGEPVRFVLMNSGDLPAYRVLARAVFHGGVTMAVAAMESFPPGEHVLATDVAYDFAGHEDAEYPPRVSLLFTDAAGRAWCRSEDGKIRRRWRAYNLFGEYMRASTEAEEARNRPSR